MKEFQNFTIIRDQPTFRKYLIQVQSVNSVGPSIVEPEIHDAWSGEDGWFASNNTTIFKVVEFQYPMKLLTTFELTLKSTSQPSISHGTQFMRIQ